MIRVEFDRIEAGPWAHEMTLNFHIATVLKEHGVPIAARLAFSGVSRGSLEMWHDTTVKNAMVFTFREPDESGKLFSGAMVHKGKDYRVYKSGAHMEDDEL